MMREPTVSVIVPVYHVEPYLRTCLDSILTQTFADFELILVNDGGSAEETEICEEYAENDARIVYLYQENRGVSAARNAGLNLARGEWIVFVDSDDWLEPDALERLCKAAGQDDADMVFFDTIVEGDGYSWHDKSHYPEGTYSADEMLMALADTSVAPYACTKAGKRRLYEGVRFPEGERWEDAGTMHIPVSRCERIRILPEGLYHYRQRKDSFTKQAAGDGDVYRWRFIQYRKRYDFLRDRLPEAADACVPGLIRCGVRYYCRLGTSRSTRDERRMVRRFLTARPFFLHASGWRQKMAVAGLMLCPAAVRTAVLHEGNRRLSR